MLSLLLSDLLDPSAVKAHAVKLLKTLSADLRLGAAIQAVLDEEPVWSSFKAQEHDLFLAPDNNAGLLAGPGGARVGLLTG